MNKDLQQIINVVTGLVSGIFTQLKDGFQYTDLFTLIPVFTEIPEAIKGKEEALAYLKDMTEEKENEIVDAITTALNNSSDSTKNIIRRIIRLLAEAYMTYLALSGAKAEELPQ